jgi:threonine/homoserine/homoserine lactone efflux protein
MQAATVNLLNPNPYLAWALVLGPAAVAAWRQSPAHAVVLLMAFYGVMVAGLAGFILLASSARFLSLRAQRGLALMSAAILAGLGVYQILISLH